MPDAYSKNIVYLSQAQYQELITNQSITVDGVTVTYNENDIYVTPQAEPVTDVRMNNVSITNNGIANIPVAEIASGAIQSNLGVVKVRNGYDGLRLNNSGNDPGRLSLYPTNSTEIKNGNDGYLAVTTVRQHEATFYGLTKAAGVDLASTSNITVGTYPDTSKAAIQNMLGITSLFASEEASTATAAHAANSLFMMNGKLTRATSAIAIGDAVEVGTNCEVVKADEVFVKNTDYPTYGHGGIVQIDGNLGVGLNYGKTLTINCADSALIKSGQGIFKPIVPANQHISVFYALSKIAGVDLASETVTVGTYPETSKTAIRTLIGAGTPLDVQINGTSIVSSGVANIPVANATTYGIAKVANYGITMGVSGLAGILVIAPATSGNIKTADTSNYCTYNPIVPRYQHESVFYGLAKAAGDTTQSASSNAVGTYTSEAKAAIQSMLGIDLQSIASEVEIPLVETVTGTTPSITGQPNTRYVCGEVSTISITPPASGTVDVIFESGSTAAVLTVPNTVKWPAWFDATSLDTDTTYELLITDGVYGSVMTWAN